MMSAQKASIFRQKAIQKYRESREKTVLPRFIAPPVFFLFWILLMLFFGAGLLVWFGQVPAYVTGSGVVLDTTSSLTIGKPRPRKFASTVARLHHLGLRIRMSSYLQEEFKALYIYLNTSMMVKNSIINFLILNQFSIFS